MAVDKTNSRTRSKWSSPSKNSCVSVSTAGDVQCTCVKKRWNEDDTKAKARSRTIQYSPKRLSVNVDSFSIHKFYKVSQTHPPPPALQEENY